MARRLEEERPLMMMGERDNLSQITSAGNACLGDSGDYEESIEQRQCMPKTLGRSGSSRLTLSSARRVGAACESLISFGAVTVEEPSGGRESKPGLGKKLNCLFCRGWGSSGINRAAKNRLKFTRS
jgi:hypothetical protein